MFITRNENNNIISAFACQQYNAAGNSLNLEEIADDDAVLQAFLNPPVNPNIAILAQILILESKQARAVRDFIIRGDNSRVIELDGQIATLRATLR